MSENKVDISVVVPAHGEGRLAHHTMNSIFRATKYAGTHGIKTEILVVPDRADENTKIYFRRYENSEIRIHHVDFGDPGLSRNYGIHKSSGKYIAFLDADDLFGKNWLRAAYDEMERDNAFCIYHPEYLICFEGEDLLIRYKGTEDENFHPQDLIESNCWTSFFISQKALLLDNPFAATPSDSGFGYEDWHWICEIIAKGIAVRIVPESCVFYRKKLHGSRLFKHNYDNVVIRPSKFFEPETFSLMLKRRAKNNFRTLDKNK